MLQDHRAEGPCCQRTHTKGEAPAHQEFWDSRKSPEQSTHVPNTVITLRRREGRALTVMGRHSSCHPAHPTPTPSPGRQNELQNHPKSRACPPSAGPSSLTLPPLPGSLPPGSGGWMVFEEGSILKGDPMGCLEVSKPEVNYGVLMLRESSKPIGPKIKKWESSLPLCLLRLRMPSDSSWVLRKEGPGRCGAPCGSWRARSSPRGWQWPQKEVRRQTADMAAWE